MPSATPTRKSSRQSDPASIPDHGQILDIGGNSLEETYVEKLKQAVAAINGLKRPGRSPTLPDELLYDGQGILTWNKIINIPEFYQTHEEIALFKQNGQEIISHLPDNVIIIDLGSGDTSKVDHLLTHFESREKPATYIGLDISWPSLHQSVKSLKATHPAPNSFVTCGGFWGTFENGLAHVQKIESPRLFLSLGSVLCNDEFTTALEKLKHWSTKMRPDDHLLIGMDGHLAGTHEKKIMDAYHSCDNLYHEFFQHGLKNANKLLGYDLFDKNDWDLYRYSLQTEPTTRHRCFIKAKKNVTKKDAGVAICKGQEMDWFDSHKQAENNVRAMCSKAQLVVIKSWTMPGSDFRQYLTRRKSDNDPIDGCDSGVSGLD